MLMYHDSCGLLWSSLRLRNRSIANQNSAMGIQADGTSERNMLARAGSAASASVPRARALGLLPQHYQGLVNLSQVLRTYGTPGSSLSSRSTGQELPIARSTLQVTTTRLAAAATGRRCFTTTTSDTPLHFDTHHVVKSLQEKGSNSAGLAGDLDFYTDVLLCQLL